MMLKTNIIFEKDLVALHLKNFNQRLGLFTISLLLKYYNIELIKIYNNEPHNGCRPKKQKRKKKQRLDIRKI